MISMTSAEAQNSFGELLDTVQRETVTVTRYAYVDNMGRSRVGNLFGVSSNSFVMTFTFEDGARPVGSDRQTQE